MSQAKRDIGMTMIHSSEFDHIPGANRYFCLARAYLDASRVLCESLITQDFPSQYSSTRVIMHLYKHSIELFLKGAISAKSGDQPPNGHELPQLMHEYKSLFPDTAYWLNIPFYAEDSESLFPNLTKNYHKTLDQRYRYPADHNGKLFNELEGFIPDMFLNDSNELKATFLQLEYKITKTYY